jgi:hypothetical protein
MAHPMLSLAQIRSHVFEAINLESVKSALAQATGGGNAKKTVATAALLDISSPSALKDCGG